jgi:hypothetical protein
MPTKVFSNIVNPKAIIIFWGIFLYIGCFSACAQILPSPLTWKTLADVQIKSGKDKSGQFDIDYPVFGEKIQAFDGKWVIIKGYFIPVQEYESQTYFVLSAFPYNLCYFCGGAGPETVLEVYAQTPILYEETPMLLLGILRLNRDDPNHLLYILEKATRVTQ